jgi:hypothetical protein
MLIHHFPEQQANRGSAPVVFRKYYGDEFRRGLRLAVLQDLAIKLGGRRRELRDLGLCGEPGARKSRCRLN